jgi:hypothetical protein
MDPTTTAGNGLDVNSVNNAVPKTDRKAYRREWMRNWREQQRDKTQLERQAAENNQVNNKIALELNAKPENIAEPQIENKPDPVIPVEEKPAAGEYQQKIIPEANEATLRLKKQLADLEHSHEIHRRQQQQADEINNQVAQVFHFWKQNGATEQQQAAFRANPAFMIQLTDFAHTEASKLHPINSEQYLAEGKRVFFETLANLEQQAKQNTATHQPAPESEPMPPSHEQPPSFFAPSPALAPRPQAPSRTSIVSAPVSRETPGSRDFEPNPRSMRLTRDQVEAARIAGVDLRTYAENLLKMERMKRDGSFNSQ